MVWYSLNYFFNNCIVLYNLEITAWDIPVSTETSRPLAIDSITLPWLAVLTTQPWTSNAVFQAPVSLLSVYSRDKEWTGGQKYVNEWTKEVQETSQTYNQNIPRNTTLEHANTRAEPGIPYECRLPDVHCTS